MMFLLDLAFAAEILALGMGLAFLVWACHNKGDGRRLAKFSGTLIIVLALLGMLCTTYYGLSYWSQGYFTTPMSWKKGMKHKKHQCPHGMTRDRHMMPGGRQGTHMEGMPPSQDRE